MRRANKKYGRITVLLFLAVSLVMPPTVLSAEVGAANKASAALQKPISSTWVNESIDKVLMDMADTAGIDIVKSPEVTGDVTAKVTGVPLEEALGNILAAHGFTYIATDNMIRVMPVSEVERATKEELFSKVYQITYADANEVAAALQRFISEKGSVAFTKGTRHIAVTDTEVWVGTDYGLSVKDRATSSWRTFEKGSSPETLARSLVLLHARLQVLIPHLGRIRRRQIRCPIAK